MGNCCTYVHLVSSAGVVSGTRHGLGRYWSSPLATAYARITPPQHEHHDERRERQRVPEHFARRAHEIQRDTACTRGNVELHATPSGSFERWCRLAGFARSFAWTWSYSNTSSRSCESFRWSRTPRLLTITCETPAERSTPAFRDTLSSR